MSAEVWYAVDRRDMFPEQWGVFLLGDDRIRAAFLKHHADLLTPEFWNALQAAHSGRLPGRRVSVPARTPLSQTLCITIRRKGYLIPGAA